MQQENIQLTSIRGVLALWVVGHHWFYSIENQQLNHFFGYAYFSVDIFFILSGFILFKIYEKINLKNTPSFYLKRFLRIFPLHLFSLIVLTAIVIYPSFQFEFNIDYLSSILLLQAFNEIHAINNPPSWSISIELICYFLFPFILFSTNKVSGRSLIIQIFLVILASLLTQQYYRGETTGLGAVFRGISGFLLGVFASKLSNRLTINNYQSNLVQFLSISLFIFCIIFSGNLGGFYKANNIVVANLAISENENIIIEMLKNKAPLIEIAKMMDVSDISVSRLSAITGINKMLIQKNYNNLNPDGKFYSIFNLFSNEFFQYFLPCNFLPLIATIFIFTLHFNKGIITYALKSSILHFLGKISFSIYLLHYLIMVLFVKLEFFKDAGIQELNLNFVYKTNIMVIVLLISSYITYKFIEQPFRKILK
jgi:hypothetical protein